MEKDIVIIGGGPGGYVAAIRGAQLGANVTLVEKDRVGGTCLNRGCIPTKAFFKSAQIINTLSHVGDFGINLGENSYDVAKMKERKDTIVGKLTAGVGQLLKANGVEYVDGWGKIIDANTVEVTGGDGAKNLLSTKNILIATGSKTSVPPIPGIDSKLVVTSDEMLDMTRVPDRIVIIGGGVIGIEFAGILNALGSKVTVVEFLPAILPMVDSDISKRLGMSLKKKGIAIETGIGVKEIKENEGKTLTIKAEGAKGEKTFECDLALVSTGREIFVENLGLDEMGIVYSKKGIVVDEGYKTNIPGIYAIGDAIGGIMLAHVASDEGRAAVENIMGLKGHVNYSAVPNCVFTFPEIGSVGLTEDEAKKRNIDYTVSKFMFGANG